MDRASHQLTVMEQRCRRSTALILAGTAFAASYGLIYFSEQAATPRVHIYPWFLAVLFYIAGDFIALIWVRVLTAHIKTLLLDQIKGFETEQKRNPQAAVSRPVAGTEVEVIRPATEE